MKGQIGIFGTIFGFFILLFLIIEIFLVYLPYGSFGLMRYDSDNLECSKFFEKYNSYTPIKFNSIPKDCKKDFAEYYQNNKCNNIEICFEKYKIEILNK